MPVAVISIIPMMLIQLRHIITSQNPYETYRLVRVTTHGENVVARITTRIRDVLNYTGICMAEVTTCVVIFNDAYM